MCLALFVASDHELPLIPWDEAAPAFNVQPLSEHDGKVLTTHFSKRHARYLGGHSGCSCGFRYSAQASGDDADAVRENELGRASVAALRAYLQKAIETVGPLELYVCWEGDEGEDAEHALNVSPDHFGGEAFELPERVKFYVSNRPSNQPCSQRAALERRPNRNHVPARLAAERRALDGQSSCP